MTLCKYFQQGNCRFGANCNNEHAFPSKYTYQATATVSTEQLIQQVKSDVDAVLNGGQWLMSCFAPYREKPCFPGLTDYSMEEVRLLIYEAKANGTLETCISSLDHVHQSFLQAYRILGTSPEIIKGHLETLYKGNVPNSPFSITPLDWSSQGVKSGNSRLENPSNTSIFSNAALPQDNVFSSNSGTASTGISPSNLFATASSQLFGSTPISENAFATTAYAQNIFASANQNQTSNSIGQNPVNVFQQSKILNNPFQQKSASNLFQQAIPANNVFHQAPINNLFSKNVDAMESSNDSFGQQSNASSNSSVFGNYSTNPTVSPQLLFQSANRSMFGSPFSNVAANTKHVSEDDTIYGNEEQLTEEDLNAYNSDVFASGSIPELPPTYALCF